jgi:hypothetical protein
MLAMLCIDQAALTTTFPSAGCLVQYGQCCLLQAVDVMGCGALARIKRDEDHNA